MLRAGNGDIIAACRTHVPDEFNRPVPEVDHYAGLGVSISADNGRTWSEINSLYAWGRHHPSLILLPDQRIVMSYVVRKGYDNTPDGYPQFGVEAIVSTDHGRRWDFDGRYVLDMWRGTSKTHRTWWASSQSTSSILLPDGSILTAYGTGYRNVPTSRPLPAIRDIGLVKWRPW